MKLCPIACCLACPFHFFHQFEGPVCMHDAENPIKLEGYEYEPADTTAPVCPLEDYVKLEERNGLKVLEYPSTKEK